MTTKTVLITGAAKRIGAHLARALHADGMNVVIHYHTSEKQARDLCRELNDQRNHSAITVKLDIKKIDSYDFLLDAIKDFSGRLDILINNASMFYPTPVGETSPDQWMELVGTNMKAPYFLVQACLPMLSKSKGNIINITDIYGKIPLKNYPVYSAAKAGLIMITRSLALELAPDIRVNAISPGAILWPEGKDKSNETEIVKKILLGKSGSTADIANTVRYLIDTDYVTGQVINVDGGRRY